MRELSAAQREVAFDLIATLLAPAAVQTVRDTMAVERQIVYQRNGAQLGPLEFHVAIHGRPAATGSWAWRVEGHHVVLMGTVHDGRVEGVTPMFPRAFPARTPDGSRLLAEEQDTVRTLVRSLTADQKAMAILGDELPMTVMTRNEPMARPLAPAGLPLSRLEAAQAEVVQRLLAIFTRRLVPAAAEAALERIRGASLDGMSLAVVAPAPEGPVYLRLQGATTVFEFLNSLGDTTHVHTVWRDFEHDYGAQATPLAAAPRVAGGPAPQRLPTVAATIAQLDSDGDGVLTSAELQPQIRARLMQADADRDGRITAEDLRAARRRAVFPLAGALRNCPPGAGPRRDALARCGPGQRSAARDGAMRRAPDATPARPTEIPRCGAITRSVRRRGNRLRERLRSPFPWTPSSPPGPISGTRRSGCESLVAPADALGRGPAAGGVGDAAGRAVAVSRRSLADRGAGRRAADLRLPVAVSRGVRGRANASQRATRPGREDHAPVLRHLPPADHRHGDDPAFGDAAGRLPRARRSDRLCRALRRVRGGDGAGDLAGPSRVVRENSFRKLTRPAVVNPRTL
ncbi:MAG: DUF3500 domain-containing protein [Planctomycetia bacterium]|nr:DUF3500 domain-containing protein [Planctomycetia bacterium]